MSERIATRYAYGEELAEAGSDSRIVVFDADVSTCTMSCLFGKRYPERFFNMGIAEANMVGTAAGMATLGYKPFVNSFAMFMAGRTFEQIRNGVAYPDLNVTIVGTHAGLGVGEDGATHQCLEDMALMRAVPNMTVICPADAGETRHAVRNIVDYDHPVYLRLGRLACGTVTDIEDYHFEIGKAVTLREGTDASIIAVGSMVERAVQAAERLMREDIKVRVLNMHTVKPLDVEAVQKAARETKAIVTAEEHNILGGLGSAVAECVAEYMPVPVRRIGTRDTFGRSGNGEKLLDYFGLGVENIVDAVKAVIADKNRGAEAPPFSKPSCKICKTGL